MINFIVCDDKKEILNSVSHIIDRVMMHSDFGYKKFMFESYNKDFMNIIDEKYNKIYILDIEVLDKSGIDIARRIRRNDNNSILIFLTSHIEEGYTVLKGNFLCLSYISKLDNYKVNLEHTLKKAVSIIGEKNYLKISDGRSFVTISEEDILYIARDSVDRKLNVVTTKTNIKIKSSLSDIESKTKLHRIHKSSLVNLNRVVSIDYVNKNIIFDNGTNSNLVSKKYKVEL